MIMHMTIHHPHPEKMEELVEALHHFERVVKEQPGLLSAHTLKDAHTSTLVSLAVWASKESWLAAQPTVARAESDENFSAWEIEPHVVYHLEEL